ncbi:SdrD B-like domain-containing protein [Amycolatopsis sp. PS_44_ISF1]|uniref:SdrD B-like domain-containing protein n=1 Tax=Amycolatopsis sp. PS_44_ISF1 TaxID=2974917 RepID=UPI0028E0849D|nr:SdrD B-like domain-containing protein [Amycolatopsis sp. PS_44_ISF1]MDT8910512.1 hypothetical protein [Amycolatopsis sp. PS_44_ISF1]
MKRSRKVAIGRTAATAAGAVVLTGALAGFLPGPVPALAAPACGRFAPNSGVEPVPVASATTDHVRVVADCASAQVAAYTVKEEVQDPANGQWGASATLPAGSTAHYRVTVTNSGSVALTGVLVRNPWCTGLPAAFDLGAGAARVLTCDHPNLAENDDGYVSTVRVSGVTAGGGKLADQKATATITVTPLPPIDGVGGRVWRDLDRNGLRGEGEPGVGGIPVTLEDGAGGTVATTKSAEDGSYGFGRLKDGTYRVCFDVGGLPDGLTVTIPGAGDPAKDSDADPATGCTAPFTLGGNHRENPDVDLGLAPPVPPASSAPSPPPAPPAPSPPPAPSAPQPSAQPEPGPGGPTLTVAG